MSLNYIGQLSLAPIAVRQCPYHVVRTGQGGRKHHGASLGRKMHDQSFFQSVFFCFIVSLSKISHLLMLTYSEKNHQPKFGAEQMLGSCSQKVKHSNLIKLYYKVPQRKCTVWQTQKVGHFVFRNKTSVKPQSFKCLVDLWNKYFSSCYWPPCLFHLFPFSLINKDIHYSTLIMLLRNLYIWKCFRRNLILIIYYIKY